MRKIIITILAVACLSIIITGYSVDNSPPASSSEVAAELSPGSAVPATSTASSEIIPQSEPSGQTTSQEAVMVKDWIKTVITDGNGAVNSIYGDSGATTYSELWLGGIPTVYYIFSDSDLSSFQLIDSSDNISSIFTGATSHDERGLPDYNVFPDSFAVDFMLHKADDLIQEIFVDVPDEIKFSKDPAELNNFLGLDVFPEYVPAVDEAGYSKSARWEYTYNVDGFTIIMICIESEDVINHAVIHLSSKPPLYDTY